MSTTSHSRASAVTLPGVRRLALLAAVSVAALAGPGESAASAARGPSVDEVECVRSCTAGEPRGGSLISITGANLDEVSRAYFTGGEKRVADLRGSARASSAGVRVRVPWNTVTGEFSLATTDGHIAEAGTIEIAPIPVVASLRCLRQCATGDEPKAGSLVLARGVRLDDVEGATLYGRRGKSDDVQARVGRQTFSSFRMRVPKGARTGAVSATAADGDRSPKRPIELAAESMKVAPGPSGAVFPIQGEHDYGSATSRFGNARGRPHRGQDVFAECGTPLVAAVGGTVRYAGYQSSAGNYVVIQGADPDWDYVYMHMSQRPLVRTGQTVQTGEQVGMVGESGNAQGCHLHFELWSAPGWYEGGSAFDPLPSLQGWDRES